MASGDPNPKKPAADLLRRALASSTNAPDAVADACPDPEILAAYAERSLDADEAARYELHFSQCATCRDQLAAMSRAAAPAPRPLRISWIWTWGWIALAPVAAVLLIAAVFIARQPEKGPAELAKEAPLVAMSQATEPVATAPLAQSAPAQRPPAPAPREYAPAPITRTKSDLAPTPNIASGPPAAADETVETTSESAPGEVSTAPVERDLKQQSVADLPMASRNYSSVITIAPAAPKTAKSAAARSRSQVPAQTQTVTVQSSEGAAAAGAPVQATIADNSAGFAARTAPSARNASANHATLAAGSMNEMLAVEPVDKSGPLLVQSPDPQVLWRISGGRYVERSADAGATWRTQWTNATAHVVAGSAPAADTCWLVGTGGIVLRTSDAKKWHTVTPPALEDFSAVSASDSESATITTKDGRQFKTRDGGKHWSPAP